jgi:hypothetical protein
VKLLTGEVEVATVGVGEPGIFHWREIAFLLAYERDLVAELLKFGEFFQPHSCVELKLYLGGIPSGAGAVSQTQRHDFLQQSFIIDAAVIGGVGKILLVGDLRIGIGFQQIELAFFRHAIIQTRIPAQE